MIKGVRGYKKVVKQSYKVYKHDFRYKFLIYIDGNLIKESFAMTPDRLEQFTIKLHKWVNYEIDHLGGLEV